VFLGHEIGYPAGTGSGAVFMAGGRQDQGAGKGEGVKGRRLLSPPCLFLEFADVLLLCASMNEVDSKYPFYILIYTNSSLFHCIFVLVKCIFNI